mgnify:CR=1 FL=1
MRNVPNCRKLTEIKNIDDIQAPSIEPDEDVDIVLEEGRTLSDFDIALEDGIVDAEIMAEVDALIEQNLDNLQERIHIPKEEIVNPIKKIATKIDGRKEQAEEIIAECIASALTNCPSILRVE